MNITVLSLSLLSFNSMSPLLAGNNQIIKNSNFKYFTQIIFYNPLNIDLNNNKFSHGLNSILISENIMKGIQSEKNEFADNYYDGGNFTQINSNTDKLVIIRDCTFYDIKENDKPFIAIYSQPTTYITNCLFNSCGTGKGIFDLNAKSITISHICCSDLYSVGSTTNKKLFLNVQSPRKSFIQFIYSTIFGKGNENTDSRYIIYLGDSSATRYQCINVSHLYQIGNDAESILHIASPQCINMLMNTFSDINSKKYILGLNLQDGDKSYSHYVGQCNFFNNDFQNCVYLQGPNDNVRLYFEHCYFSNNNNNPYFDVVPPNDKSNIYITNCYFNKNVMFISYFHTTMIHIVNNLTPLPLAHFNTANVCRVKKVENAYGCNNGTCPDNKGCGEGAFDFKDGEYTYTQKYHPDIDTPAASPTLEFTRSSKFTESSKFTKSSEFAESSKFSKSSEFTPSTVFTRSSKFTKSAEFAPSTAFTGSSKFTKSSEFTPSTVFTGSSKFTKSAESTEPTKSEPTSKFSQSNAFTNSTEIIGDENSENNGKNVGMIAGIAAGATAAAVAAGIGVFFFIKAHPKIPKINDLETIGEGANTVNNPNPLYDNNAEEDPFKDDFTNN